MEQRRISIKHKLMRIMLMISGFVVVLTSASYFTYEYFTFRQVTKTQLYTLAKIIAANSTASLAFDNREDANEILNALKAEKNIINASLYDINGRLFAKYPAELNNADFPASPKKEEYIFKDRHLEGFQPVLQGEQQLGTLYLKLDMKALYERMQLYGIIALLVSTLAFFLAYFVSRRLQKTIAEPILKLATTARIISEDKDYSVRATEWGRDELGILTNAFNHMLNQIEHQNSEITSFNQVLEQRVVERNEKLNVMNNALIKSNRELEQFAYVASHDLQEPLRKIQTFTELAERNLHDPEAAGKYFERIFNSAKRMSDLIKAVLNYSRLSKTEEQFEDVDLNEILNNIQTDFELLIAEKQAVIHHDQLPIIKGNPLQLHQLFLNLISNSLKFSEKTPVITITARTVLGKEIKAGENVDPEREYAELTFTDNGIGFEQDYADKIFVIFQRLQNSEAYAGTGIGLALCKRIVENHHGVITAQSEVGKGATFHIYLPVG